MTRSASAIVLSVALLAPLIAWLLHAYQISPQQRQRLAAGMVAGQDCLPEPGERMAYVVSCLLAPLLLAGCSYGLSKICRSDHRLTRWASVLLDVALAALLLAIVWIGLGSEEHFALTGNSFYERPWLALVLAPLLAAGSWFVRGIGPLPAIVGRILGLMCCGIVGLACISGVANHYVWENHHFAAVFDPVSQVSLGRHLLVDCDSQYGLYADFLSPLFGVMGLSIAKFTCVLGFLGACSFAAIWIVLDGSISRGGLKWLGLLSLLYNGWALFLLKYLSIHPDYFDSYFQYMPLRFCFPAGLLLLYWSWLKQPRAWLYWFTAFFLSVGVLWNVDSGAVAWPAWLLALCYQACQLPSWPLRLKAMAGHALVATTALVSVIAAYSLAKYIAAGHWPDFSGLFAYQRLFYVRGFKMLPMPLPGTWILAALVYLAGLARSFAAIAVGDRAPKPALIFLLSILGCGLFSYFQGRSHPMVLLLAWWPALVLLPLLLDEVFDYLRLQPRSVLAYTAAGVLGWFMMGSAVSLAKAVPTLGHVIDQQLATLGDPHSPVTDDARLLAKYVGRQDDLLILSYRASLVHWAARIPSVAEASPVQMLETEQYRKLSAALDSPHRTWLLIERDFDDLSLIGTKSNPGTKLLLDHIASRMHRVAANDRADLYELIPAPQTAAPAFSRMTSSLQPAAR